MRNGVVTDTKSHDNVFILHDESHMITKYCQVYVLKALMGVYKIHKYYNYYIK